MVATCALLWVPVMAGAARRPVPTTPLERVTEARIEGGGEPDWLVSDGSSIWVQRPFEAFRIDPTTNTVTATVTVEDEVCQGLGFGDGSVWRCADGGIVRIDPATATVLAYFPLDKSRDQGHLPVVAGRVWVITGAESATLSGLNTATGAVDATIALGGLCTETVAAFDSIWVACRSGELLRVDPVAGTVVTRVSKLPLAIAVTANEDSVFVGYERGVARVDPDTNAIAAKATAPSGLSIGLTADDDNVWLRSEEPAPFLRRIDVDSMKVVERITSKLDSGGDVLLAFGSLWTSTYDDAFVFRLTP